MEELTNVVAGRTGLSLEQSRLAAQVVVEFLEEKLPGPIAAQVSALIGEESFVAAGELGSLARGIEGMFERPA